MATRPSCGSRSRTTCSGRRPKSQSQKLRSRNKMVNLHFSLRPFVAQDPRYTDGSNLRVQYLICDSMVSYLKSIHMTQVRFVIKEPLLLHLNNLLVSESRMDHISNTQLKTVSEIRKKWLRIGAVSESRGRPSVVLCNLSHEQMALTLFWDRRTSPTLRNPSVTNI